MESAGQAITIPEELQPIFNGATEVPIQQFNRMYGTIINAKTYLGLAANKSEAGLVARILSGSAGAAVGSVIGGGPIGAAVGAAAGEGTASRFATPIRSVIGATANKAGSVLSGANKLAVPAMVAGQAGQINQATKKTINVKKFR